MYVKKTVSGLAFLLILWVSYAWSTGQFVFFAIRHRHLMPTPIAELVFSVCNLDVRDKNGSTPLYVCTRWVRYDLLDYLMAHEDEQLLRKWVKSKNQFGETILQAARCNIPTQMLERLIDYGASVNGGPDGLRSPLANFARCQFTTETIYENVKLLLKRGANPNVRDLYSGKTPLHEAASNKDPRLIRILIDAGADANARDNTGETPLWYATVIRAGLHLEPIFPVIQTLLDYGANPAIASTDSDYHGAGLCDAIESEISSETNKNREPEASRNKEWIKVIKMIKNNSE